MTDLLRRTALLLALVTAGCSTPRGGSVPGVPLAPSNPAAAIPADKTIKHIVIMIQENRSFDNLFADFPGADGARYGILHDGTRFKLKKAHLVGKELNHVHSGFVTEYDGGKMDGFDQIGFGSTGGGGPAGTYPLRFVEPGQIQSYWSFAEHYALADHMFQTQGSGSFTAHQDLIAAGSTFARNKTLIDFPSQGPWGCDAPKGTVTTYITPTGFFFNQGPFPCLKYATLADLLDPKGISWKYYTPPLLEKGSSGFLWNAFDAIRKVRYGPDWKGSDVSPETKIFDDIKAHRLPAVSWVIPSGPNSDHAAPKDYGPSWVASVVNAIGKSSYWNSSAIIIVWDDWGGYFDHVTPPQLDYDGLGFRVPMIVVSPYVKRAGYISHTQYEFGSIVRFVEDNWNLGRLGATDVRATSIGDMFDLNRKPLKFKPGPSLLSQSFFQRQPLSPDPPDDE